MEFISILLLISFFWNTMHQIFIPAVTVRSWFKKDYFTNATFKLKVVVIHLRITVMAFCYAIFMQHMQCFCKQKKSMDLVGGISIIFYSSCFAFWKKTCYL